MLALYHGANSVCSIKVRIVLEEKGLDWESRHIDLPKGEQFSEAYKQVNPRSIVPVLDHDGQLVHESSVISEYVDSLGDGPSLQPSDPFLQAKSRTWGIYTLEYHDSVNTLTFASYQRQMLLKKPAEELAARWASMPNRIRARKMKDLVERGAVSDYVPVALESLQRMCAAVEADLSDTPWLLGEDFSLADALLAAYFYRVECIGLSALWETRFPKTTRWWGHLRERTAFRQATDPWLDAEARAKIADAGQQAFLSTDRFAAYLS